MLRSITTPPVAGGVVLLTAVVVAVLLVVLQPHAVEEVVDVTALLPESLQVGGETESELVFVHVTGEVLGPGVVELAAGSRVEAAIEAAEGVTEAAVLDGVNLARIVIDGEQIMVPNAQSEPEPAAAGATSSGLTNLNTADTSALETLPRIGPALAALIIDGVC